MAGNPNTTGSLPLGPGAQKKAPHTYSVGGAIALGLSLNVIGNMKGDICYRYDNDQIVDIKKSSFPGLTPAFFNNLKVFRQMGYVASAAAFPSDYMQIIRLQPIDRYDFEHQIEAYHESKVTVSQITRNFNNL